MFLPAGAARYSSGERLRNRARYGRTVSRARPAIPGLTENRGTSKSGFPAGSSNGPPAAHPPDAAWFGPRICLGASVASYLPCAVHMFFRFTENHVQLGVNLYEALNPFFLSKFIHDAFLEMPAQRLKLCLPHFRKERLNPAR